MRAVEHLAGTWYWLDDLQAAVPRWGELALPGFCKLVGDPCKGCVTRQIASLAEAAPVALACCWAGAKVLAVNVKGRIAVYFSRSRTEDAPYLSDLSDSLGVESEQLLAEWGLLPKFGRNLTREVLRQHDVSQQVKEQLARLADVYDPAPAQVPDMYDMDVRVFHAIHGLGTIDGVLGADVIYACNGGLPVVRWFRRSTTDQDGREGESPIRGFCAVGDAVSKLQAYLDTWEGILRKPGTSNAVESS
ncbi:MAG: hypothetical protein FJX75_17905, partial [Armatimonadetes bacterium]|nr:hypothetical protein [Armatimonadota bacterium]